MNWVANRGFCLAIVAAAAVIISSVGCMPEPVPGNFKIAMPKQGAVDSASDAEEAKSAEPAEPAKPDVTPVAMQAPAEGAPKEHPFRRKIEIPDFPAGMEWINTKPLSKKDLKGKFVLIDFWTYCCINCIHILPELKKLEKQYPNELVVIGVHSAKFDTEKDKDNILSAVLRYEVIHPVVNDHQHEIWDSFGVSSWPSAVLVDPEGYAVVFRQGEFKADEIGDLLKEAIPYYKANKLLDDAKPFPLDLEAGKQSKTTLRFPGKVLADEKSGRLFISDSNHNRIVVTDLDGKVQDVIGGNGIGKKNGTYAEAQFDHPQGCALDGETLYVADTENHLLRKVDLLTKKVTTIAGIGEQAKHAFPGLEEFRLTGALPERWVGPCRLTALNSPWDLWIHNKTLFIAMAGPHQIWAMPLDESEIGPYAGNGREDIVDGPLMPPTPYEERYCSFAQPSGLASDGEWLFVADSEGSSIRAVPFDRKKAVRTVVGTADLPRGRLFQFGDVDGPKDVAKLQHALGVTYLDGQIYVTDTYNNKVKVVDAKTGETTTFAGSGKPGKTDDPPAFDEPAGIAAAKGKLYIADTNNHLIRTIDLKTKKVGTLAITGLEGAVATQPTKVDKKPTFFMPRKETAPLATLKPEDGKVTVSVELKMPAGWKLNEQAPMRSYWVDSTQAEGPIDRTSFGKKRLTKPTATFEFTVPVTGTGEDVINVSLDYYYCETRNDQNCKVAAVIFTLPVKIAADAKESAVTIRHTIPD